jgi:hypothetical protein
LPDRAPSIVLLIGSYDNKTRTILDNIKEETAKIFSGKVFAFLLDDLELYTTNRFEVLTENQNNQIITLYLFEGADLYDVQDLPLTENKKPDEAIYAYLRNKFDISRLEKKTLSSKFDLLMSLAIEIFLVRDLELTRGGEYLEMMHTLFTNQSEKLWFFMKNSITLSSMLMEYLDIFRVKMRTYKNYSELRAALIRIITHSLENQE